MSRYLYKKIQNISPESLNFQHSGLKLTTLPTDPIEDKGILEKIDRLVSEKISAIHVGVCRLPDGKHECPRMTQICNMIEKRGIKVVRGTHKE